MATGAGVIPRVVFRIDLGKACRAGHVLSVTGEAEGSGVRKFRGDRGRIGSMGGQSAVAGLAVHPLVPAPYPQFGHVGVTFLASGAAREGRDGIGVDHDGPGEAEHEPLAERARRIAGNRLPSSIASASCRPTAPPRASSTAQATASTTLGNSARMPSPVVLKTRPPKPVILGSRTPVIAAITSDSA
jgi:hypothetical protein